jgi:hypothetical protein
MPPPLRPFFISPRAHSPSAAPPAQRRPLLLPCLQITHGLLMRIFCMCYFRWTVTEFEQARAPKHRFGSRPVRSNGLGALDGGGKQRDGGREEMNARGSWAILRQGSTEGEGGVRGPPIVLGLTRAGGASLCKPGQVWNPSNCEIWVLQKVPGKITYELAGRWRASPYGGVFTDITFGAPHSHLAAGWWASWGIVVLSSVLGKWRYSGICGRPPFSLRPIPNGTTASPSSPPPRASRKPLSPRSGGASAP